MEIPEKKLGFGCMRLPLKNKKDQTSIDDEEMQKMADYFMSHGFNYFDTAYMYHDFESERAVGRNIVDRFPREDIRIATKMPDMMLGSAGQCEAIFEEQKEKLHTDYFDYYLVHDMNNLNHAKAVKFGVIEYLQKKRESGEIRCLGFSFHDTPELLDEYLTKYPFFEFVQLQINYLDWESAGIQAKNCYDVAVKHGKKVIAMEPVKGGALADPIKPVKQMLSARHPEWSFASWAVRFAASFPEVMLVLSGMTSMEQMTDNVSYMEDFEPLNDDDMALLKRAAASIEKTIEIPCTGCRYCVEASTCPQDIWIPDFFSLYNTQKILMRKGWTPESGYYSNYIGQGAGRASGCIGCRACEEVCPQHIHISEWMPKVAKTFEG